MKSGCSRVESGDLILVHNALHSGPARYIRRRTKYTLIEMIASEKHERAIVVYDSKYGNTAQVAKSVASGLQMAGIETACYNILDVSIDSLESYDMIAVGGPTQAFTASKPMKDFLQKLGNTGVLNGKRGFAFDTRFASRLSGSAAKYIEKKLAELGMHIIKNRQSAIVKKTEGPLEEGELEEFERIGFEMGSTLARDLDRTQTR